MIKTQITKHTTQYHSGDFWFCIKTNKRKIHLITKYTKKTNNFQNIINKKFQDVVLDGSQQPYCCFTFIQDPHFSLCKLFKGWHTEPYISKFCSSHHFLSKMSMFTITQSTFIKKTYSHNRLHWFNKVYLQFNYHHYTFLYNSLEHLIPEVKHNYYFIYMYKPYK